MTSSAVPAPGTHRTSPGGVVLVVAGVLLMVLGAGLLAGGVAAARLSARGGGIASPTIALETGSRAITTPRVDGFGEGIPPMAPMNLGRLRIDVTGERQLFVGIAPRRDVAAYLAGVAHAEVTEVRRAPDVVRYRDVPGSAAPSDPATQSFWAASASGSGPLHLEWAIRTGDWAVVVMNADGTAGVTAGVRGTVTTELLAPAATALLVAGSLLLLAGVALVLLGTAALGRAVIRDEPLTAAGPPVRVIGSAGEPLSRWLWLVKWLLAVPHLVLLAGLWIAFTVTAVASGVVVLVTGRYPRAWFAFEVGVLRWSWRVAFYGYSALGTDRYPPFALGRRDYPADVVVAYPDRLVRGLVLVKWLLAIPHALVLAALAGSWAIPPMLWPWGSTGTNGGFSVLAALVLVAAVLLLFTGRYPRGLFDLVVGIGRWVVRVAVYVSLLRDEYPPFRLDQGPDKPVARRGSAQVVTP